jgi:heterodisulfide reductase subunit C/nitrate reductase gamma subunit
MIFSFALYLALILFGLGTLYKVVVWFRSRGGVEAGSIPASARVSAAFRGVLSTLFSKSLFTSIQVFVVDVLLQKRLFDESRLRWAAHMCLSYGFLLLLLMHALDRFVTKKLFTEYAATLNPFFFLRNLFGVMVLFGQAVAVYRRLTDRVMRLTTRGVDIYALVVLALIILSGFLLEGTKIVSHQRYEEMVSEFSSISDNKEALALRAYWAKEFAVVFPQSPAMDPETLKKGQEVHALNCVSCHSKPKSAFLSYGLAKAISPIGLVAGRSSVRNFLWYFHFLVCFLGLALLPFSKFFHILTSPLMLVINGVMDWTKASPANKATVRAIELDACTHCATCSLHCSVEPIYREIPNKNILPSEKLGALAFFTRKREKTLPMLPVLEEGASICTKCYRCTQVCPVGIQLQDLWFRLGEDLIQSGCPTLFSKIREAAVAEFEWDRGKPIPPMTLERKQFRRDLGLSFQGNTFNHCFTCVTCSNACPVVVSYQFPREKLGLLPHQIMYSLKFGIRDNTLGAGMIWDCLGCYNCQESCPQGIRVTDILFELKSIAFHQGENRISEEKGSGGRS